MKRGFFFCADTIWKNRAITINVRVGLVFLIGLINSKVKLNKKSIAKGNFLPNAEKII